jgi:predicted XRE-type DNA-binding protein
MLLFVQLNKRGLYMDKLESAFELITDDPVKIKLLQAKSDLMDEVIGLIKYRLVNCEYTQLEVATMLGVTQPRISRLLNGKFSEFSIDMLTKFKYGLE